MNKSIRTLFSTLWIISSLTGCSHTSSGDTAKGSGSAAKTEEKAAIATTNSNSADTTSVGKSANGQDSSRENSAPAVADSFSNGSSAGSGKQSASANSTGSPESTTSSTDVKAVPAKSKSDKGLNSNSNSNSNSNVKSNLIIGHTSSDKTDAGAPMSGHSKNNPMNPQVKINLGELPGDLVICTVAGDPIKVNEYRNMLKLQEIQMQNNVAVDPSLRGELLQLAQKQGLSLTNEEKYKLLNTAKAQHKNLATFLKDQHLSEQQFEQDIINAGIEMKAANAAVESGLLSQIVSRKLLCKAASSAGMEKSAIKVYDQIRKSKNFEQLQRQAGLSQKDLRDELIKGQLAQMQIAKLAKPIVVSEAEIKKVYDNNKKQLYHGERIKLATMLIACPEQDIGPVQSIATQIKRVNAKLSGKDLDTAVAQVEQKQQNKALILLSEAKSKNVNFAKLVNENTDDLNSRARKNGGDMGWQSKHDLVPPLVEAVWNLKPGTVLPKLVKTSEGFCIIKVVGHEKSGISPLSEVHDLLSAKIKQEKLSLAVNHWIEQQQKTYRIDFSPRFIALAQGAHVSGEAKTH